MQFRVLGPLQVLDGEREIELGATKPRALLLRLLLDANRLVAADRLIDDLWEGEPPRSAAQTLQTYVSQLRKAIGAERVVTQPGGYELAVDAAELDAAQFEEALTEGRAALRTGDANRAADGLRRALARWRGAPFTDAAGATWAATEVARLEELRLAALESLIDARFELGEHRDVIAVAEAAVAEHPLREPLWARLMTALYRDGRQADALRAYGRLRTILAEELGIDPSPELQGLEGRMLRQEVEVPSAALPPRSLPSGVVTFLLTDVVSSTRLWETAPNEMAGAVERHEQLLRSAVEAHNGVFLKHRGEGDSTFSVFPRATDAVAAASEAQRLLGAEHWATSAPFEVRIAVHTGEALERDGDYYGRTVNRAARLRAATLPGQVLVSQATAELVVDDLPDGYRLAEMGVQELRDLDRPETVFAVAPIGGTAPSRIETTSDAVPMPARLGGAPLMGFVGRVPERDALDRALKHAAAGNTRVVLIAGEPGIGKTALAAEVARGAHADGATVVFGRCDEDGAVPYRAWVEALAHLVAHLPKSTLESLGPRQLADLARLVPAVADRIQGAHAPPTTDLDADRWSLFTAVTALLAAASADAPAVLVLDDLQWADKPTLLLLRHVVDAGSTARLLIVGTYRDSELTADHPLTDVLAALRREATTERITLRGLADREVVALVESLTRRELEPAALELVHAVYRESDGNPFFATALLRHLAETGAVYLDDDGRWVPRADLDEAGLPESVREVMDRRVARLGEEAGRILQVAAVMGQEFDLATLARASGITEDGALEALEAAEAAGLLTSTAPGRFAFAHTLVAHTQYAGLSPTRCALLHRDVAEAIEAIDPTGSRVAELARHWAAATSPDHLGKAIDCARAAGDLAMRSLAPDEAIRWFTNALELLARAPDDAARCDLLVRLGRAQRDAGEDAHRRTLLDAARLAQRIGNDQLLVYAALANSRGFLGSVDPERDERVEMLEAALDACDPGDSALRARVLATLAAEIGWRFEWERIRALCDEALAMARRLDNPVLLARVLNNTLFAIWHPGTLEERLELSAEAVALAQKLGGGPLLHWSAMWRVHALVESAEVDEAAHWLAEMTRIAREAGYPAIQWSSPGYLGALALLHGDIEAAQRFVARAEASGVGLSAEDASSIADGVLTGIAHHRGRLADEVSRLTEVTAVMHLRTASTHLNNYDLALAYAHAGRADDARELLDRYMADRWMGPFTSLAAVFADVCARVGTANHARALLADLEPYHAQVATSGAEWRGAVAGAVGTLLAQLGRYDDADRAFAEAEEINERIRAPFHLARHRVAWAKMLLTRDQPGDAERAREILTRALEVGRAYGCDGVVRDAEALLATPPPLPAHVSAATAIGFVGREAELTAIAAVDRGLVLVAGDPGIGKSALVARAAANAYRSGAWVLYGRCDDELRVPYRPFVDVLAQIVEHLSDAALDAIGDRHLAQLARIVPSVPERRAALGLPQSTDPETERYLLMNAVVATLTEAARHAPAVLVLDDLQWADKPTLMLLRHVLTSATAAAITVLATYRPSDITTDAPLGEVLPALRSEQSVQHLALAGLTQDEVLDLTGADDELAAALHHETGGNPFFTTELYRHLRETGTDLDAAGVPDTIRGLVARRVGRLGNDVRTTLATASVVGQEFDLELLSRVLADPDDDTVLDALERAETAALVQTISPGRFAFAHGLVQHSLYAEIAPTRRARLHLSVADAIEGLGAGDARIAELARHTVEGAITSEDVGAAVRHATAAGDRAFASTAPDEAVRWYRQALELLQRLAEIDDEQRCRLLLALAEAQVWAGDQEFRRARRAAAELAIRLGAADLVARAALMGFHTGLGGEADADVSWLFSAALELLPDEDSPSRAFVLARLAYESMYTDTDLAIGSARAAVSMARRLGDRATLADVIGWTTWRPGWIADFPHEHAEGLALAEELGDPSVMFRNAQHGMTVALTRTDLEGAEALLARMVYIAGEIGRPDYRVLATNFRGYHAMLHGDLEEAEELINAGRELGDSIGFAGIDVLHISAMACVRWQQGRQAEVADLLAAIAERNRQLPILALPVTAAGTESASDLSTVVASLPRDATWSIAASIVSDLIARQHDVRAAARLYDELLPLDGEFIFGGPMCRGPVAHALGVLAGTLDDVDTADRHFASAVDVARRMRAPFFVARTGVEWSTLLLERDAPGDAERAREMLVDARAIARERGFSQIERRADRALAQTDS